MSSLSDIVFSLEQGVTFCPTGAGCMLEARWVGAVKRANHVHKSLRSGPGVCCGLGGFLSPSKSTLCGWKKLRFNSTSSIFKDTGSQTHFVAVSRPIVGFALQTHTLWFPADKLTLMTNASSLLASMYNLFHGIYVEISVLYLCVCVCEIFVLLSLLMSSSH